MFDIEQRVFAGSHDKITNSIQSDFTVLDDDRIALLRRSDRAGISLDLFTQLRVNQRGVCEENRALEILQRDARRISALEGSPSCRG